MSFAYFLFTLCTWQNSLVEALHANYDSGKIKSRKKSLGKEKEKNRLKKERNSSILPEKKRALPKATKALGLAKCLQQSRHLLKIRSWRKSLELVAFWYGFCLRLWRLYCVNALNMPFATSHYVVQNPPCWRASSLLFPHWDIKTKRPEPVKLDLPLFWCPYWTWQSEVKKRVAMRCFSRKILTYCHRREEVFSLVCGFIRRDNLQS